MIDQMTADYMLIALTSLLFSLPVNFVIVYQFYRYKNLTTLLESHINKENMK